MKFASFGRERDLSMIKEYVTDPDSKVRRQRQTSAAHDLNDGIGSVGAFLDASRAAVFESTQQGRDAPLILLIRISRYYPECLQIWDELADSPDWRNRFTAACRLYLDIPNADSDRLFSRFRSDKSKRVRAIAVDRYENRANEKGEIIFGAFHAGEFDERVRRGEVKV